MSRFFLECSYKGTNYHGWQKQPNAISVQEEIERALSVLLRSTIEVVGCGRTDAGVHASKYILHFDCEEMQPSVKQLAYRLNRFLPQDIAVQKIWKVKDDIHARFNAVSRTYKYYIATQKNPFTDEVAYQYTAPLRLDLMNIAALNMIDYKDFTSFSKLHTDVKNNNCTVYNAFWQQSDNQLIFTIKANRFLRNMVRAIVGTLLEVGKEKITVDDFCKIIEKKDRGAAGASAPAHGLFLYDIEY